MKRLPITQITLLITPPQHQGDAAIFAWKAVIGQKQYGAFTEISPFATISDKELRQWAKAAINEIIEARERLTTSQKEGSTNG